MNFSDAVEHAKELETTGTQRNQMYVELEKMYMCEDDELPSADWIKPTVSPDARNAIDGAARLLSAADPIWSVPLETNTRAIKKKASTLERAAKAIWQNAGIVSGRPRHYDPILSSLLYSEIQIPVISTTKLMEEATDPKQKERWKRHADKAPIMFDSINPREGYSAWGLGGLDAYYSKRSMLVGEVRSRFGEDQLPGQPYSRRVSLGDYWSLDTHMVWVEGETKPLVEAENPWPFIPVVSVLVEGSMMFAVDQNYQTRQPFLYTVYKTGIWKRQNLFLTLISSLAFEVGASPLLVFESAGGSNPVISYDTPGGIVRIQTGEKLYPMNWKVITQDLVQQAGIMDERFISSTMYRQVLGEPVGGNAPFSMVSLLSQAGRLPLVVPQRILSFALTQAMQMAFEMIRIEKVSVKVGSKTGVQIVKASDIPEEFDLQAKLDITMPQDDRLNAQVAQQLTSSGLVSNRYARETYLNIGQSDDMEAEIHEEQYVKAFAQADLQAEIQKKMMAAQGQPNMPPGSAPQGMNQPGQPPPDMTMQDPNGMMPPDAAQEGLPMMGPAEPMGSPMGPGGMPPEMEGMNGP